MTITLLELPKTLITIPPVKPYERLGPTWHKLSPCAKIVEQYMAQVHKQKFLYSTALTSRLQIKEILKEHNEK